MPSIQHCISLADSDHLVERQPSFISLLIQSPDNLPLILSKVNRLLLKERESGIAHIQMQQEKFSLPLRVEFVL